MGIYSFSFSPTVTSAKILHGISPYISIESGKLTAGQKKELIERLTATASEITHIPEQFFTVTIKELPDENFGIGGKSIDEIKRNYEQ